MLASGRRRAPWAWHCSAPSHDRRSCVLSQQSGSAMKSFTVQIGWDEDTPSCHVSRMQQRPTYWACCRNWTGTKGRRDKPSSNVLVSIARRETRRGPGSVRCPSDWSASPCSPRRGQIGPLLVGDPLCAVALAVCVAVSTIWLRQARCTGHLRWRWRDLSVDKPTVYFFVQIHRALSH